MDITIHYLKENHWLFFLIIKVVLTHCKDLENTEKIKGKYQNYIINLLSELVNITKLKNSLSVYFCCMQILC